MTCQGDAYANENIMILLLLVHLKAIKIYEWKNFPGAVASQVRSWLLIRIG